MQHVELGDKIRSAREAAGMSQEALAKAVDVSPRTIGNWERGESSPRSKLGALERLLAVRLRGGVANERPSPRLDEATDAQFVARLAELLSERDRKIRELTAEVDELRAIVSGANAPNVLPGRWAARRREDAGDE